MKFLLLSFILNFPDGSGVKNLPADAEGAGDTGLIPESGRSPGEENGNPLPYSCLENPHGQRNMAGYNPWGHKRVEHDLATKQQPEQRDQIIGP